MAQLLAIGDLIKAQIWTSDSEQAAVNTLHYHVTGVSPAPPSLQQFLDSWAAAIVPKMIALLTVQAKVDGTFAQVVLPKPLQVGVSSAIGVGDGTGGAFGAARQTSGLISWRSQRAGPGGRGRTYVPFPASDDTEGNGIPNDAYMARLGALTLALEEFVTFTVGTNVGTVELIVKSHNSDAFNVVTSGISVQKWATMRRRGSFGRPNFSPFA